MAPNINTASRFIDQRRYEPEDDEEEVTTYYNESKAHASRQFWKSIVLDQKSTTTNLKMDTTKVPTQVRDALSSIRILDSKERNKDWLLQFAGSLHDVPKRIVQTLKERAPDRFTARVADFNDNLWYDMQSQRGLEHLGIPSHTLKEMLGAEEYLGSFLTTETSMPQPPHVDYTWQILDQYSRDDLKLGFFPLTSEGMFLQVWQRNDTMEEIPGEIIFVPYGKLLVLPADTIHGGGYRTAPLDSGVNGNLRFHLYMAQNEASLPEHQTNKYTEPNNKGKELSWRYVDAPRMKDLLDLLFV